MLGLVGEVRKQLLNYESYKKARKRARRKDDQRRFDLVTSGLICELVHCALDDPRQWRRISLSKDKLGRRNVGPEFVTEALRSVVDLLRAPEMDWVELEKGTHSPFGRSYSTIRASKRLRSYASDRSITFADIGRDVALTADPLVLRSEKVKGEAKQLNVPKGEPADTYRAEMLTINRWLAQAGIVCDESTGCHPTVDVGNRWLTRIFNNGSLSQGGRLYGGFWSAMKSDGRLRHIYINREPVVGLDYGQCVVRIAYGHLGLEPPADDLYTLHNIDAYRYRDGVKKVFNAMLFSKEPLKRKPQDSAKVLPKNYTISELQELIRTRHAPIAKLFHVGFGMESQFIESQILVRCLLTLIGHGVVALPVHDCIVVPRSSAQLAKQVMLDSFRDIAGAEAVVDIEALNSGPGLREEEF